MKYILLFLINYLIVLGIYELFIVKKAKKDKRKKPIEVKLLVNKFGIDLKKVNYNKLLQVIALVSSLDITVVIFVAYFISNYFILIVVAVLLTFILLLVSYYIIGIIYRKKMIK